MADVDTLRGLLERVKQATGPDRRLDGDIQEWSEAPFLLILPDHVRWNGAGTPPPWSGSLDAALALAEGMLPEKLGVVSFGRGAWQRVDFVGADGVELHAVARTGPLAVLAIILKALIAQAEASA